MGGAVLREPGGARGVRKGAPPDQTNAESFYYLKQMQARTPMVVQLVDGEELRGWIEAGDYDRILRGEYSRRGDPDPDVTEDLRAAMNAYAADAKSFVDEVATAARRRGEQFRGGLGF